MLTLLPVAVMGPVLGDAVSGSNHMVQRMLDGAMPGFPNMYVPIVDVRDVALAHVAALTAPDAAGRRFLVSGGPSMGDEADRGDPQGEPRRGRGAGADPHHPNLVVRVAARFNPALRPVAADLGFVKKVSNEKAVQVLGLQPRPAQTAILAAARTMIAKGLVKREPHAAASGPAAPW